MFRIRILPSSSKNTKIVRKPFISTVFWLFNDFLSLKNDVNVPIKSNKQKKPRKKICWLVEGYWRKEQDPILYLLFRGSDLRIRIRTKMSKIRNTANSTYPNQDYLQNCSKCSNAVIVRKILLMRGHSPKLFCVYFLYILTWLPGQ